jgi:hypothetical protein
MYFQVFPVKISEQIVAILDMNIVWTFSEEKKLLILVYQFTQTFTEKPISVWKKIFEQ